MLGPGDIHGLGPGLRREEIIPVPNLAPPTPNQLQGLNDAIPDPRSDLTVALSVFERMAPGVLLPGTCALDAPCAPGAKPGDDPLCAYDHPTEGARLHAM